MTSTFPPFRIGQGYDCHALVSGRKLIIGGVDIAHTTGLLGHSDADVLLHAITDALLGAAGLGDIGRHFPDTDKQFVGADSRVLLREALARVHTAGYLVGNLDATIIAQQPKAVLIGMISQLIIAPLFTLLLIFIFQPAPDHCIKTIFRYTH